jgi:DNA (cytosine-5)-methyltransferase 1
MRHGSLFSGIGGFDLASEWMGWENVFHCEWNEFGHKVLNYYWPKAISYHDITKTDFSVHRGTIDIITGGFPCQPYSMAGKRKGKDDERHLWPEMLRAIREIQPTWVVGENVLGLVNWDGGLVFHEVQADLEAQGYEVQPYVLPAASVNAPHRRDRVWFVAYSKSCADSRKSRRISNEAKEENGGWIKPGPSSEQQVQLPTESGSLFRSVKNSKKDGWRSDEWEKEPNIGEQRNSCSRDNEWIPTNNEKVRNASDSSSIRQECREEGECSKRRTQPNDEFVKRCNKLPRTDFKMFPSVPPICTRDDGISDRLDSITFSKWRNESIKAGGNAVVPQVVHQIFKAIEQYNQLDKQLSI